MELPAAKDEPGTDNAPVAERMVEVRFLVPETWRDELLGSAHSQRISLADLMRIVTRGFLRERYDLATQKRLGLI